MPSNCALQATFQANQSGGTANAVQTNQTRARSSI
jgi:hypothetical protein